MESNKSSTVEEATKFLEEEKNSSVQQEKNSHIPSSESAIISKLDAAPSCEHCSPVFISVACPLHSAAPALYHVAQEALPIIKTYIEEIGGCDHSVGICCCDVIALREQLEAALALANTQDTNTLASSGKT